jgi:hypothetical protein
VSDNALQSGKKVIDGILTAGANHQRRLPQRLERSNA